MIYTAKQLIYRALRQIGYVRAGAGAGAELPADVLNDCFHSLNEMMEVWTLNNRRCFHTRIDQYTLTAGTQFYFIGPGATPGVFGDVPWGAFDTVWPTMLQQCNIILNNSAPPVRQPVDIVDFNEWSLIRVQQITSAIPLKIYYDASWSISGAWKTPNVPDPPGIGKINLWPGPQQDYQLELFTPQQLQQFVDLTTTYYIPLAYASPIINNLALELIPSMAIYIEHRLTAIAEQRLQRMAAAGLYEIDALGTVVPDMIVDPAFTGTGDARGAFNYLTGGSGSSL